MQAPGSFRPRQVQFWPSPVPADHVQVLPEGGAKYASTRITRLVVRVGCCMWQVVEAMEAGCAGGLGDPGALQGARSTFMLWAHLRCYASSQRRSKLMACGEEAKIDRPITSEMIREGSQWLKRSVSELS